MRRNYWTTGRLRTLHGFIKVHKTLEVLMSQVEAVWSNMFLLGQVYIVLDVTLISFMALRPTTEFHLRIMCLLSNCVTVPCHFWITRIAGNVFEDSKGLLKLWERKGLRSSSLNKKYLKSLRPIQFRVGMFCYCDREFYVSSLHFIFDNVVNLLISTQ